ncbi:MAG: hypothetical protein EBZ77_08020, partial [Chitinophagia bacterium]|nr:hypothetical protein [Chitinophagia bacterium]
MVNGLFFAWSLFLVSLTANAREPLCSHAHRPVAAKTTTASAAEDDYDVNSLRFRLHMTDTSVYVAGDVSTSATVVASSMPAYVFELDTSLTIDSATVNGTRLTATNTGFIRSIALPAALTAGTTFTARIWYHGLPPGGGGGFFNGITHATSAAGTHMVYTVSDPYAARNWWPCKQSVTDKIDTVDMLVSVPAGVADGSNGRLLGIDSTTEPGWWTYHWHTNYPIDYYLISVAIARYARYEQYHHLAGTTDTVLIQNFFLDTATFNPVYKPNFDSIGQMMDFIGGLYGTYPFKNEKYGVCYTNLPGGMEHQTMTTIGIPNTYIIAHELAHQWFGDHVTYRTWGDVWLSEGFATYTEQLYYDHFWSPAAALQHRQSYLSLAISQPCGMVYVSDTSSATTLFSTQNVYAKGSMVVRMLQYAAPDDSTFFRMLRDYQQTYAFGLASTGDLKTMAERYYGHSLDTFFNQWIYGKGYPLYRVSWHQSGTQVWVKLIQSPSCASGTRHFSNFVELKLHAASGDTIVKVYNSLDTQTFYFNWAPTVTTVYLNPDVWTLCRLTGSVTHDPTLAVACPAPPITISTSTTNTAIPTGTIS